MGFNVPGTPSLGARAAQDASEIRSRSGVTSANVPDSVIRTAGRRDDEPGTHDPADRDTRGFPGFLRFTYGLTDFLRLLHLAGLTE